MRQKFEDSFKDAFKGAEVEPSDSVWTNVELDLEKASGGEMKRKLLFFQLLAAASMVFAMGIGAVYFLSDNQGTPNQPIAQQLHSDQSNEATINKNTLAPLEENQTASLDNLNNSGKVKAVNTIDGKSTTQTNNLSVDKNATFNSVQAEKVNVSVSSVNHSLITDTKSVNKSNALTSLDNAAFTNRKPSATLVAFQKPTIEKPVVEADPGMLLLARLEDEARMLNKDEDKIAYTEKIWTSFGAGAGSYDPRASGNSPPSLIKSGPSIATDPAPKKSSSNPSPGSSYSVGLSFAGKLSRRVVLQGGFSYLSQNAEFTSSTSDGQKATLNEVAVNNDNSLVTSPYKVNNNLKYLSVPIQAGYIVMDRSFGIQLNGGVSTDLFLQSTLTPADKSLDKTTQGSGSDSPYRTVNFSGLVGTEFSYRIGDHYRIALNPGLRYALHSIYKSEIDTEISPMTFDVSLRFRYIIK